MSHYDQSEASDPDVDEFGFMKVNTNALPMPPVPDDEDYDASATHSQLLEARVQSGFLQHQADPGIPANALDSVGMVAQSLVQQQQQQHQQAQPQAQAQAPGGDQEGDLLMDFQGPHSHSMMDDGTFNSTVGGMQSVSLPPFPFSALQGGPASVGVMPFGGKSGGKGGSGKAPPSFAQSLGIGLPRPQAPQPAPALPPLPDLHPHAKFATTRYKTVMHDGETKMLAVELALKENKYAKMDGKSPQFAGYYVKYLPTRLKRASLAIPKHVTDALAEHKEFKDIKLTDRIQLMRLFHAFCGMQGLWYYINSAKLIGEVPPWLIETKPNTMRTFNAFLQSQIAEIGSDLAGEYELEAFGFQRVWTREIKHTHRVGAACREDCDVSFFWAHPHFLATQPPFFIPADNDADFKHLQLGTIPEQARGWHVAFSFHHEGRNPWFNKPGVAFPPLRAYFILPDDGSVLTNNRLLEWCSAPNFIRPMFLLPDLECLEFGPSNAPISFGPRFSSPFTPDLDIVLQNVVTSSPTTFYDVPFAQEVDDNNWPQFEKRLMKWVQNTPYQGVYAFVAYRAAVDEKKTWEQVFPFDQFYPVRVPLSPTADPNVFHGVLFFFRRASEHFKSTFLSSISVGELGSSPRLIGLFMAAFFLFEPKVSGRGDNLDPDPIPVNRLFCALNVLASFNEPSRQPSQADLFASAHQLTIAKSALIFDLDAPPVKRRVMPDQSGVFCPRHVDSNGAWANWDILLRTPNSGPRGFNSALYFHRSYFLVQCAEPNSYAFFHPRANAQVFGDLPANFSVTESKHCHFALRPDPANFNRGLLGVRMSNLTELIRGADTKVFNDFVLSLFVTELPHLYKQIKYNSDQLPARFSVADDLKAMEVDLSAHPHEDDDAVLESQLQNGSGSGQAQAQAPLGALVKFEAEGSGSGVKIEHHHEQLIIEHKTLTYGVYVGVNGLDKAPEDTAPVYSDPYLTPVVVRPFARAQTRVNSRPGVDPDIGNYVFEATQAQSANKKDLGVLDYGWGEDRLYYWRGQKIQQKYVVDPRRKSNLRYIDANSANYITRLLRGQKGMLTHYGLRGATQDGKKIKAIKDAKPQILPAFQFWHNQVTSFPFIKGGTTSARRNNTFYNEMVNHAISSNLTSEDEPFIKRPDDKSKLLNAPEAMAYVHQHHAHNNYTFSDWAAILPIYLCCFDYPEEKANGKEPRIRTIKFDEAKGRVVVRTRRYGNAVEIIAHLFNVFGQGILDYTQSPVALPASSEEELKAAPEDAKPSLAGLEAELRDWNLLKLTKDPNAILARLRELFEASHDNLRPPIFQYTKFPARAADFRLRALRFFATLNLASTDIKQCYWAEPWQLASTFYEIAHVIGAANAYSPLPVPPAFGEFTRPKLKSAHMKAAIFDLVFFRAAGFFQLALSRMIGQPPPMPNQLQKLARRTKNEPENTPATDEECKSVFIDLQLDPGFQDKLYKEEQTALKYVMELVKPENKEKYDEYCRRAKDAFTPDMLYALSRFDPDYEPPSPPAEQDDPKQIVEEAEKAAAKLVADAHQAARGMDKESKKVYLEEVKKQAEQMKKAAKQEAKEAKKQQKKTSKKKKKEHLEGGSALPNETVYHYFRLTAPPLCDTTQSVNYFKWYFSDAANRPPFIMPQVLIAMANSDDAKVSAEGKKLQQRYEEWYNMDGFSVRQYLLCTFFMIPRFLQAKVRLDHESSDDPEKKQSKKEQKSADEQEKRQFLPPKDRFLRWVLINPICHMFDELLVDFLRLVDPHRKERYLPSELTLQGVCVDRPADFYDDTTTKLKRRTILTELQKAKTFAPSGRKNIDGKVIDVDAMDEDNFNDDDYDSEREEGEIDRPEGGSNAMDTGDDSGKDEKKDKPAQPEKKKRGRPPKAKPKEGEAQPEKKKRGRPPKAKPKEGEGEPQPEKKKRGRPRKNEAKPKPSDDGEDDAEMLEPQVSPALASASASASSEEKKGQKRKRPVSQAKGASSKNRPIKELGDPDISSGTTWVYSFPEKEWKATDPLPFNLAGGFGRLPRPSELRRAKVHRVARLGDRAIDAIQQVTVGRPDPGAVKWLLPSELPPPPPPQPRPFVRFTPAQMQQMVQRMAQQNPQLVQQNPNFAQLLRSGGMPLPQPLPGQPAQVQGLASGLEVRLGTRFRPAHPPSGPGGQQQPPHPGPGTAAVAADQKQPPASPKSSTSSTAVQISPSKKKTILASPQKPRPPTPSSSSATGSAAAAASPMTPPASPAMAVRPSSRVLGSLLGPNLGVNGAPSPIRGFIKPPQPKPASDKQ